jgi:DNA-binding NtrC family response regulator
MRDEPSSLKIVMFGFEEALAAQLAKALSEQDHVVQSLPFRSISGCSRLLTKSRPDVVFCSIESKYSYLRLLQAIKQESPAIPVIVVSRLPEPAEWLRALEAGAADYCSPPFESAQIKWTLKTALSSPNAA